MCRINPLASDLHNLAIESKLIFYRVAKIAPTLFERATPIFATLDCYKYDAQM